MSARPILKILAGYLALASQSALAAEKFDLICTGTQVREAGGKDEAYQERIRIDLASNQYCVGQCDRIERFQDVTPLMLTLVDERRRVGSPSMYAIKSTIDRRTGELSHLKIDGEALSYLKIAANCEAAEFTPFPETKF